MYHTRTDRRQAAFVRGLRMPRELQWIRAARAVLQMAPHQHLVSFRRALFAAAVLFRVVTKDRVPQCAEFS